VGPLAAEGLSGERIAVTSHRDGAADVRAISDVLEELGVAAELVTGPPGPMSHAAVAENEIVMLTTAPEPLPGAIARRLDPQRSLGCAVRGRGGGPPPAGGGLISRAGPRAHRRQHAFTRGRAAVA